MVAPEFADSPTSEEVKSSLARFEKAKHFPRGITGGRPLKYDEESETLTVDFEQLTQVLLEHQMYEQARGFNSTEMDILRVIERDGDRLRFDQIKEAINEYREEEGREPLEDSTIHHYLGNLRDKNLISHEFNDYSYLGP